MRDKDLEKIFEGVEVVPDEIAKQKAKARMLAAQENQGLMQKLFRRNTMKTVKSIFTMQRLQGAAAMLLVTAITLTAIAFAPGVNLFGTLTGGTNLPSIKSTDADLSSHVTEIQQMMEPVLGELIIPEYPYIQTGRDLFEIKWRSNSVYSPVFQPISGLQTMLAFSYQSKNHQDYQIMWTPPLPFPVAAGRINSDFTADVFGEAGTYDFDGKALPAYVFTFTIRCWVGYDYNSTSNQGYCFDQSVRMAIGVQTDSNGNTKYVKSRVTVVDHKPSGVKVVEWGKFLSLNDLQSAYDRQQNNVKRVQDNVIAAFNNIRLS